MNKNTYGLKSSKTPKPDPDLKLFEEKMKQLIPSIRFKAYNKVSEGELGKINEAARNIKARNKLLIPAHKTRNWY